MKNKKKLCIAFLWIYFTILIVSFLKVYFPIYLKTGEFTMSKDDLIWPIKSTFNILAIYYTVRIFFPSDEKRKEFLEKMNNKKDK